MHAGKSNDFNKNRTFAGCNPISILRARARELKLPSNTINSCINDIESWYHKNGPEWTVKRLKFVKQCCINYMTSGEKPPTDAEVWFKKNKNGLLYGPWSTIMKLFIVNPKETAKFIQFYTVFAESGEPSSKSIKAYQSDIEKPFSGCSLTLKSTNDSLSQHVVSILNDYVEDLVPEEPIQAVKPEQHILLYGRFNNKSHKEEKFYELFDFLSSGFGRTIFYKYGWVRKTLGLQHVSIPTRIEAVLPKSFLQFGFKQTVYPMCNIRWIFEPGMKDRVVADYSKTLECLIYPMGKYLYKIVKQVPWDATYHEDRAFQTIQYNLKQGKKGYSFDLSKATDRFPLELQATVLKSLSKVLGKYFTDMSDIYLASCKEPARLPNGVMTRWSVGQPMGSYPSFALFSLTHGLLLMDFLHQKGESYSGQFVVHGDDIVIFDEDLANYYRHLMPKLGTELNGFKSIESYDWAEFNSKLISRNRIINMPKLRPIDITNIQDQVTVWGPKVIKYVFKSKKKQMRLLEALSIPYILPNGGSINVEGRTLEDRLSSLPEGVLDYVYNPHLSNKKFVSYRALVLNKVQEENYLFPKQVLDGHEVLLSDLQSRIYLSMLTSALEVADNLDKDLLQQVYDCYKPTDCKDFTNYNLLRNGISTPSLDMLSGKIRYIQETYHIADNVVKCSFIPQASVTENITKQNKRMNTTRLNKVIKLLATVS